MQQAFGLEADIESIPNPPETDEDRKALQSLLTTKYEEVLNKYNEILELLQSNAQGTTQMMAELNEFRSHMQQFMSDIVFRTKRLEEYNLTTNQIDDFGDGN